MLGCPFRDKGHCATRQRPPDRLQVSQVKERFVLSVEGVEVRRSMFPPEHLDNNAIKTLSVGMPQTLSCASGG